jgi:hypothetical protein
MVAARDRVCGASAGSMVADFGAQEEGEALLEVRGAATLLRMRVSVAPGGAAVRALPGGSVRLQECDVGENDPEPSGHPLLYSDAYSYPSEYCFHPLFFSDTPLAIELSPNTPDTCPGVTAPLSAAPPGRFLSTFDARRAFNKARPPPTLPPCTASCCAANALHA